MKFLRNYLFLMLLGMCNKAHTQIIWPYQPNAGEPCRSSIAIDNDTAIVTDPCEVYGFFSCIKWMGVYTDSMLNMGNLYNLNSPIPYGNSTVNIVHDLVRTGIKDVFSISDIAVKFGCLFRKNRTYGFNSIVATGFINDSILFPSRFKIELTNDSCGEGESVFISSLLDTFWRYEKVVFSPQVTDYNILRFTMERGPKYSSNCFIDTLTPILPHNGNDVRSNMNDTVVKTPGCFTLMATANISTYDTVYWKDSSGAVLAQGFDGGTVCPQASTYYVIAMRDSVPDCAGYWWSYDTVRIGINPALGVEDVPEKEELQVYPIKLQQGQALTIVSPANARLEIYTIDGKKVGTYKIEKGRQQLVPEHSISSQMLMLRFYMSDGSITFRKVILN